jgi:hypothetical protein
MGQLRAPSPVLLIAAIFSRHADALAWAEDRLSAQFGPIGLVSLTYDFVQTEYYQAAMGAGLKKRFLAFERLASLDCLPEAKTFTNHLEEELASGGRYAEARPLNIDPGILSLGKLQLATTKDQGHRIYLRDGIFAEVTLRFEGGEYAPWPWTYADYRLPTTLAFMKLAREYYRARLGK